MDISKHTICLTVNNRPGVLIRVALVYSRRGYNIESLVVSESKNPQFAKMSIIASGDKQSFTQIIKQLSKLIDVVHIAEYTEQNTVHREIGLYKFSLTESDRGLAFQIMHALNGEIIELGKRHCIVQISGTTKQLDNMSSALKPFGILEAIRTGKVLIRLGEEET